MASICSRIFGVSVITATNCTILLQDNDPITVTSDPAGTPFRKNFSYAVGQNPNPSVQGFGFTLTSTGVPTGVSVEDIDWEHERPDTHQSGLQSNYVTGRILVSDMYVGDMERSINLRVQLNTGV